MLMTPKAAPRSIRSSSVNKRSLQSWEIAMTLPLAHVWAFNIDA
jgi:hypothetical protein